MDSPIFSQTRWEDCGLRREVGGREECGECEGEEGMKERHFVLISLGKSSRCKCEEIKRFWGLESLIGQTEGQGLLCCLPAPGQS